MDQKWRKRKIEKYHKKCKNSQNFKILKIDEILDIDPKSDVDQIPKIDQIPEVDKSPKIDPIPQNLHGEYMD